MVNYRMDFLEKPRSNRFLVMKILGSMLIEHIVIEKGDAEEVRLLKEHILLNIDGLDNAATTLVKV